MGKRRHLAAWGATFALTVAACAAIEPTQETSSPTSTPQSSSTPSSVVPTAVTFPESLADASFVRVEAPDGPCAAGDAPQVALVAPNTGDLSWSFDIPRPGTASVVDTTGAYISTRWDRGQHPGIAAIDLKQLAPMWQRFLPAEVESMIRYEETLIVVTSDDVRAVDITNGNDLWIHDPEFDFSSVVLGEDTAFTLDSIGVHAIDYATGDELWELPIQRADTLAASGDTLAVAADTRLVAIDVEDRTRVFDKDVSRLGAGDIWVTPQTVAYELDPNSAPGGGVAVLDRNTGGEIWRATSTGDPLWVEGGYLISSTANDEPQPAARFVLTARDGATGKELWRTPSNAQAFDSVIGAGPNRVVAVDPHPGIPGAHRLRLLDSTTGLAVWEMVATNSFDNAVVTSDTAVTLFGSSKLVGADRGSVAMTDGSNSSWSISLPDGIAQAPMATPQGLLVISGERSPTCISRLLREPSEPESGVLSATVDR